MQDLENPSPRHNKSDKSQCGLRLIHLLRFARCWNTLTQETVYKAFYINAQKFEPKDFSQENKTRDITPHGLNNTDIIHSNLLLKQMLHEKLVFCLDGCDGPLGVLAVQRNTWLHDKSRNAAVLAKSESQCNHCAVGFRFFTAVLSQVYAWSYR